MAAGTTADVVDGGGGPRVPARPVPHGLDPLAVFARITAAARLPAGHAGGGAGRPGDSLGRRLALPPTDAAPGLGLCRFGGAGAALRRRERYGRRVGRMVWPGRTRRAARRRSVLDVPAARRPLGPFLAPVRRGGRVFG